MPIDRESVVDTVTISPKYQIVMPKKTRESPNLRPGQNSSGWLEYFGDGPNADFFGPAVEATDDLIVPTLSIYEVFKRISRQRSESDALPAVALMQPGSAIDLTAHLASEGARTSTSLGIPMAESMVLATARAHDATLWTQDADFAAIEGVRYAEAGRTGSSKQ